MCGRFALHDDPLKVAQYFRANNVVDFQPSFNIAPSSQILTVTSPDGEHRVLSEMHWGLIPSWAKDATIANKLTNARGESVAEKPSFRSAFRNRRCIIPANGFFEWKLEAGKKYPWYFTLKSGDLLAMAGLWEAWRSPEGEVVRSCCIITTDANQLMQPIHDRMPVILEPNQWEDWLSPDEKVVDHLKPMIYQHDAALMQSWPVTREINRVGIRNDAGVIQPVEYHKM